MENSIPGLVETYFKDHCLGKSGEEISSREFNMEAFFEHANTLFLVRADVIMWLDALIVTSFAPISEGACKGRQTLAHNIFRTVNKNGWNFFGRCKHEQKEQYV